ncbi:MAG: hypothetical protein HY821_03660 [Acidobacteria bacterium]|nr:hypothetical protein [Acidobacteriota bacterium]
MQVRASDPKAAETLILQPPLNAPRIRRASESTTFQEYVRGETSRSGTRDGSGLAPQKDVAAGTPGSKAEHSVPAGGTGSAAAAAAAQTSAATQAVGFAALVEAAKLATAGASVPAAAASPATTERAAAAAPAFAASAANEPTPAAAWPMNLVTPSAPPELAQQSKAALAGAMVAAGLDPAQYKVAYWEELVSYPGGNFMNKFLTVEAPNGQKTDFNAQLTLNSPWVTAATLKT